MSSKHANGLTVRSGIVHALAWDSPRRYTTYRRQEMPYTRCGKQQWHGLALTYREVTCKGCLKALAS